MGIEIDLKKIESKIHYVPIQGKTKKIEIPIFLSMGAIIKYEHEYKNTNDCRIAFCSLIMEMIKTHSRNDNNKNVEISEIEDCGDNELFIIMNEIIKQNSEYIGEYFEINQCELSYENFYNSYKYQSRKFAEQISNALKPLNKDLFKPMYDAVSLFSERLSKVATLSIPKFDVHMFDMPKFDMPKLYETFDMKQTDQNITELISLNSRKDILNINTPLQLVEELKDSSYKYQERQLAVFNEVKDILIEDKNARNKSAKRSSWFSIIALIIATASFIGLNNIGIGFNNIINFIRIFLKI